MLPKVSIVIPGYNCAKTIQDTLRACISQNYPKDLLEVIFVDDGSSDDTKEIVKKFPVKYFWQNQEGPARARNRGWKEAGGGIILFTDSDCIPDKNWVPLLLKNFDIENIGAAGGSYGISNSNNIMASCIHAEIIWRHKNMPSNAKALGSYNMAIPRKILEELGGFNETYSTSSAEDNDLSYRLLKKGYKLFFDPETLVYHYHPEKFMPYLKHQFRHGFWRMKLYREHPTMAKGDDYSGFWDYLSPPVALLVVIAVPFLFITSIFKIFLLLIILHVSINLFKVAAIAKVNLRVRYFYLFWLLVLRDYWRGIGMFMGIIRFFIIGSIRK
ncbi:MAG: glycosyltransferase [Candidatus Omnitrophica bacterium]|nr:glycosyltransferase [Candidatus Omnitrophota bacterium]